MTAPAVPPSAPPPPKRPILIVGAGGIVRDAHLPAYALAGFPVEGIHDLDPGRARALAKDFAIPKVFPTLDEMFAGAPADAVFDLAVPASALSGLLERLPDGAPVLIQKPFGEDLAQARSLLALCRRKRLRAAVNFQLRYAPAIAAARRLIAEGAIGEVNDLEARVTVHTPWQLWTFLERSPRVEILYHSIHYVDLIRSFLGDPRRVQARTLRHPKMAKLASTRTAILLDYGDLIRATITANDFGLRHQESYVKWEGSRGAIKARLGVLLDYPRGEPDALELCTLDAEGRPSEWRDVPLTGNWFPHGFIGPMADLQRFAAGAAGEPPTAVADAFKTMAAVEAAYLASEQGGVPPPSA